MSTVVNRERVASQERPASVPLRSRVAVLWRSLPTVAVIAVLVGLGVWGHSNDWKLPAFASLGRSATPVVDDWCSEHNVPESKCIECNASLLPKDEDYGWCETHGVAGCPLEHPDVAELPSPPTITQARLNSAAHALALKPRPENSSLCKLHQRRIQFTSVEAIEKAGVDIAVVKESPVLEAVASTGEVGYDQTRMAQLSSRVAGTVWRVEKKIGDEVAKGELLALIDASEVGTAKSEFLQAIAHYRLKQSTHERLLSLGSDGIIAGRQLREAEAEEEEARIRLQAAEQLLVNLGLPVRLTDFSEADTEAIATQIQFLGLPDELVASLDARSTTSNLFPLRAPLDGVIVTRNVVEGEVVDVSRLLFGVADVSRLWLTLNVRQEDAAYVSLGQSVLFRAGESENDVRGSVTWISTAADEKTRTVEVRVELPNADGLLRANTFGVGRIVLRDEPAAIVVPTEALHWDGMCHVVFVRDKSYFEPDAPKFFHVRPVRTGVKAGDITEIIVGLLPGEVIASKNSVVLEAQLLKGNLGAGCDCVQ